MPYISDIMEKWTWSALFKNNVQKQIIASIFYKHMHFI